jgi:hypothetical protein
MHLTNLCIEMAMHFNVLIFIYILEFRTVPTSPAVPLYEPQSVELA